MGPPCPQTVIPNSWRPYIWLITFDGVTQREEEENLHHGALAQGAKAPWCKFLTPSTQRCNIWHTARQFGQITCHGDELSSTPRPGPSDHRVQLDQLSSGKFARLSALLIYSCGYIQYVYTIYPCLFVRLSTCPLITMTAFDVRLPLIGPPSALRVTSDCIVR